MTRGVAECITDVLTTFWRLLWSITKSDARQHGTYLFYIITKSLFYFKIFQNNVKAGLLPRLGPAFERKKAIWRDLWSVQNETISLVAMRSKVLRFGTRKIAPLSKPDSSVAPRWMRTYSESRTEVRNLQILKKMREKSSQFLTSERPVSRKAWTLPYIWRFLFNTLGPSVPNNPHRTWYKDCERPSWIFEVGAVAQATLQRVNPFDV